jgi:hypothetical protein
VVLCQQWRISVLLVRNLATSAWLIITFFIFGYKGGKVSAWLLVQVAASLMALAVSCAQHTRGMHLQYNPDLLG